MVVSANAQILGGATTMSAETKSGTVLDRIIEARRAAIAHRKKSVPETALRFGVKHALPLRDFAAALTRDSLNVIAELQKAAPSRALLPADFHPSPLAEFLALGRELGMEPLVEVQTREELTRALAASARIIGVNNRDLRTLEVRVETSVELIAAIPEECIAVCESGLRAHDDLIRLRA